MYSNSNYDDYKDFLEILKNGILFDDDKFEINILRVGSDIRNHIPSNLEKRIHSIDFPEVAIGFQKKFNKILTPTSKDYSNLATTWIESDTSIIKSTFFNILSEIYIDEDSTGNGGGVILGFYEDTSFDLEFKHLDSNKLVTFYGCVPTTSGSNKFDSSSEGTLVLISINLSYKRFVLG